MKIGIDIGGSHIATGIVKDGTIIGKETRDILLSDIQTSKIYEYMGLCDIAKQDYMSALMNIDKAIILSDDDEYLENKYNEIKEILENNNEKDVQE